MRDTCSFDGMVTADIDERYDNVGGTITAAGRNGTNGLHVTSNNGYDKFNLSNHATYGVACSYKQATLVASTTILSLNDGGNTSSTRQVGLIVDATGKLSVFRGSTSTIVATTAGQVIFAAAQHHIQFQATINNTTGAYEVRVDGVNILSGTGANTRTTANNQANSYSIAPVSAAVTQDFDDVYVWDGSGTINNTFPGDVRVFAVLPSGAGNSTQWTPSTGSNFQCVDETTPNTSDYVSSQTATQKDTYAYTDIAGSGTVLGAALSLYAEKAAAGSTRGVQGVCRSSTTEATSTEVILGTSWRYWVQAVFETDPATAAAWASVAALNAAEFGFVLST